MKKANRRWFETHPVVFPTAAIIIVMFVGCGLLYPEQMGDYFSRVQDWIVAHFGWFYVLAMSGFLVLALWLCLSRYGDIRLGKDAEKPEFSTLTWFAMLFSAGMGIGLLFWSVAEPIYHYHSPPIPRGGDLQAARNAMGLTIFHWGLHPWSLYALVALSLAYFGFRRGLPLSFRSVFYPIFGDRIHGRLGDMIDVIAVCATLFGVATSLGLGAMQVNAGLEFLLGVPQTQGVQLALIAGITALATISVVLGLHGGIRRLSNLNILLAFGLMCLVFVLGPTQFLFNSLVSNIGSYIRTLPEHSFMTGAFEGQARKSWLGSWTVYYWGWWIAWSPFVGMFIARVSRGRTVREFIIGVLLVPTAVSMIWLTVFGSSAMHQDIHAEDGVYPSKQYDVQVQGRNDFPVAASGALVGPQGVLLRIDEQGRLYEVASGKHVSYDANNERLLQEGGEPLDPSGEPYSGAFRSKQATLSVAEYLNAPVLNPAKDATLSTVDTALFVMLDHLPWAQLTALLGTLCVILFFVTSSDSASMVIDIISSGGNDNPPVGTRLFWAIMEGCVGAVLLVAGGLTALQTASITAALPLSFLIVLMCYSLCKGMRRELAGEIPEAHVSHIRGDVSE